MLVAAVCVAAIPFVAKPFLELTVEGLDDASAGAVIGSFLAVLLLCAPPVVLLGMVSPFAIRLAVVDRSRPPAPWPGGCTRCRPRARCSARSCPALVLIPAVGTQRTFLVIAALLAASSCFLLGARYLVVAAALAALVVVPPGAVKARGGAPPRGDVVPPVHPGRRADRTADGCCYLNEGVAVHSVWRPDSVLTGGVWDAFLALPPLLGAIRSSGSRSSGTPAGRRRARSASTTRDADVDGVELDPAVSRVGRRYFGMGDNPRLTVHDADARPFLRSTDERYDLIVVDAYRQPYVPFYLATREFFRLVREHLAPGGIVALNVAAVPDDKRLVRAVGTTLAAEFPQVLEWPALRFNTIVLGLTEPLAAASCAAPARARAAATRVAARAPRSRRAPARGRRDGAWTDDRAPVEWLTDRMIVSYAAEGGRLDEDYLPTRPTARDLARAARRAPAPHRPPRSGGAGAREHARVVPRCGRGGRRPHRVRRPRARVAASSSSRTRTISAR